MRKEEKKKGRDHMNMTWLVFKLKRNHSNWFLANVKTIYIPQIDGYVRVLLRARH